MMNETELENERIAIENERTKLEREKLEFERKKRDERFFLRNFGSLTAGAISLVAVLVSVIQVYNSRQQSDISKAQVEIASYQKKLAEAQTMQGFIPHLLKDDASKELALITMNSFLTTEVVTELAKKLPSKAAVTVLQKISEAGEEKDKQLAQTALQELEARRNQLIEQMFDEDKSKRITATTQLIREWSSDPKVIPIVLKKANEEQPKRSQSSDSGVINTLVFLQNTKPEFITQYEKEINDFTSKVKNNGPQTANLALSVSSSFLKQSRVIDDTK